MSITNSTNVEPIQYASKTAHGWCVEMYGLEASDGSDIDYSGKMGVPMINLKIGGSLVEKARVRNKRGKWLPYGSGIDKELGNDTDITGVEIVGKGLMYAVHIKGGQWSAPIVASELEGDSFAGFGAVIDAIWIDQI